jgi:hypothetical protein
LSNLPGVDQGDAFNDIASVFRVGPIGDGVLAETGRWCS